MIITKSLARLGITVATGLLAVACTSSPPAPPTPDGSADPSSATGSATSGPGKPGGTSAPRALGDQDAAADATSVGAPFDPCKVGWEVFPQAVRPQPDRKPTLRPPGEKDPFAVACRWDNSPQVEVTGSPGATPKAGAHFLATVFWSKPGKMTTDPANEANKGSKVESFSGKSGLLRSSTSSTGEPMCGAMVNLANGVGGVLVTNGVFTSVDTCSIAKAVADAVAAKTP